MMVKVTSHSGGVPDNLISAPATSVEGVIANNFLVTHLPVRSSYYLTVGGRKLFVKVQMPPRKPS